MNNDCGCIGHEGPHWLHMDKLWREMNRKLLDGGDSLGMIGFAKEEIARLNELERNLKMSQNKNA